MGGLITTLAIMGIIALLMCAAYKHTTGNSLPKDLLHDIFDIFMKG